MKNAVPSFLFASPAGHWALDASTAASELSDAVDLWLAPWQDSPLTLSRCRALLCCDEIARCDRIRIPLKRDERIVSRAFLRMVLSRYLHCTPEEIRFEENAYGKPGLSMPVVSAPVHFNVSHAGGAVLIAVTGRAPVGVDIERFRDITRHQRIAGQFFSSDEVLWLMAAPPVERNERFFRIWTRKEAFIKALGRGMKIPLSTFSVLGLGGQCACTIEDEENNKPVIQIKDIEIDSPFCASLACEASVRIGRQTLWRWES